MKANEIRVGNYLYDSVEDVGVIQVREIKEMAPNRVGNMSISYLGVKGGYCTTSLQENEEGLEPEDYFIQPILLTEEWLIRFGFEKAGFGASPMFFSKNDLFSYIEERAYGCNGNYGYCLNDEKMHFLELKYVHQLQNLYFVLTGKELILEKL